MINRAFSTGLAGLFAVVLLTWSCTKLDTTTLGSDLIPEVDNINTFADTMDVIASQGFFDDTTRIVGADDHVFGRITADPLFGSTEASMYFQPKPGYFPFFFGSARDTIIGFDSVVLSIKYKGNWGDAGVPVHVRVNEIPVNAAGNWDSIYKGQPIDYAPPVSALLGEKTISIPTLSTYQRFNQGRDSANNQIRIKLDSTWGAKIFFQDSSLAGAPNNAFFNDSIFRERFKGLGVSVVSGQSLIYTNLTDENTRLEFHFRKRKSNIVDTIYSSLRFSTRISGSLVPSAHANKVTRDRSSGQYPPAGPSDEIYLQTSPGTFASLSIPELNIFKDTNRVIHNARIKIEQIPHSFVTDSTYSAPPYLYLDLRDTTLALTHKPVYLDLNPGVIYNPDYKSGASLPFYPGSVEFGYFGGFVKRKLDQFTGVNAVYYEMNISRYIQRMVINDAPNYELRLFAPYVFSYPQFTPTIIPFNNNLGYGRVRVGGTNGNYRMKLIVVYSKVP